MSYSRITSRQNPRVKAAALLRSSGQRGRQGRFVIDGGREIGRALAAGIECVEAYVCDELCTLPESRAAIKSLEASGAEILEVTPEVYEKLAFGERDDGVIAVATVRHQQLSDVQLPANPLIAVLEGIEKPGNVGAILRSADAAGVDAVIVADGRTDLYNPNTIRASLGTVFRANVCEASSRDAISWLQSKNVAIIAARPDADAMYTHVDLSGAVAIVLGSEASGLTGAWSTSGVTAVKLPMLGLADSLNVSTTAAVLFYESLRQRA